MQTFCVVLCCAVASLPIDTHDQSGQSVIGDTHSSLNCFANSTVVDG